MIGIFFAGATVALACLCIWQKDRIARLQDMYDELLKSRDDVTRRSAEDHRMREYWYRKWSDAQVELGKFDRARAPNGRFVRRQ